MGIAVDQVSSRREMRRFIRYPLRLYRGDPCYVPHLLAERREFFSDDNPIFRFTDVTYLLARDERGRVVGRLTAHVNARHNEFWDERTGFFGFFECERDPRVAGALLSAAEQALRARGMTGVRGPFNFSTNQECGLLVEGFDRMPALMMPYTKPYYPELMARCGYEPARDLLAYSYEHRGEVPPMLARLSRRVRERGGVHVRRLRMDDFENDVRAAFGVYNRAWARNWGFVPMSEEQFAFIAGQLKMMVDPTLALIAEIEGEPVGFSLALPDYNPLLKRAGGRLFPFGWFILLLGRRKIDAVRLLTLGVVPEHRKRGIDALLVYRTYVDGVEKGYLRGEFSWVLEENVLLRRFLERMGAVQSKRYRIYEKAL